MRASNFAKDGLIAYKLRTKEGQEGIWQREKKRKNEGSF
jgi:hypothetical protein